jgi:hypothetical protein
LLCDFTNGGIIDHTEKNVLTTVGDAKVSTSVVKYGTGAMYFDGTGNYLTIPDSNNFAFGAENFTVEAWVYITANGIQSANMLLTQYAAMQPGNSAFQFGTSNTTGYPFATLVSGSTETSLTFNSAGVVYNSWSHLAYVRNGNSISCYINGVQNGASQTYSSSLNNSIYSVVIGNRASADLNFNGYVDDLRITKGVARYTAAFTPPQRALPDISSSRYIDLNDGTGYITQEDGSLILADT